MGTSLEGCQLNKLRFGVRVGASDGWKRYWGLQFSVGVKFRDSGGKEKVSVRTIGV